MYVIRVRSAEGDWRTDGETSVHVSWGDEERRTCGRFNQPFVWDEPLAFERAHPGEDVRVRVVQLSPLGEPDVTGQGSLPFRKGAFSVAGVEGHMTTLMDNALRQLVRVTEEKNALVRGT